MMSETGVPYPLEWLLDMAAAIPRGVNRKVAEILGQLWYRLDGKHRRIALRNLEIAYGNELEDRERRAICRKTFNHIATVLMELPYLRKLTVSDLERFVTFEGVEHFYAGLKKRRGLLFMTSHFGNWELMALAFSLAYHPSNIVVRPLDNPILDRLIQGIRTRGGNQMIPKKGSVRKMLGSLSRGEVVALLIDQNVDFYDGVFVPFFREIACTIKALAVLALRTGAPVIPAYNVRRPDGRYKIIFEPEVPLIRTGDRTIDIEENTALFNRIIEGYVRSHPEQWFWVHQRWKTRPSQPWPRQS
ncbi:MAG: lysophospholipid acyltransferase family protein [Deltaproteobacteria bacterium]|nr:MAG: lysophospholipid acyltransferase family protein [Deltaproteobacteria bacterium]